MEAKALELESLLWSSMAVADSESMPSSHVLPDVLCCHWAPLAAQTVKDLPAGRRPCFSPGVRKILWRREWLPLQYSCLENSMDRGAWWVTVHGVAKTRTQPRN